MWSLALGDLLGLFTAAAKHSNLSMALIHLGPWATVSSMCFFVGALVGGDLLALRGALMLAYVFSLVNGLTGVPSFPYFNVDGRINVDMVCWAVMSGCLHGCAVFRMLLDELPVHFSTEDDEQLARFLNRRSGMERLEARETLKRGQWLKVSAGERIVSSVELHEQVFLLVEGKCCFNSACCFPSRFTSMGVLDHHHHHSHYHTHQHSSNQLQSAPPPATAANNTAGGNACQEGPPATAAAEGDATKPRRPGPIRTHIHHEHTHLGTCVSGIHSPECSGLVEPPSGDPPLLRSGHMFSLSALNVFGVYIGFDQDHGRHLEVWAETDCLLYCWPMAALEEMATNYSPALASYWRNFIMYSIASEFEHRAHKGIARCSTGEHEHEEWLSGARSRDFTDELRPYEVPAGVTWVGVKRWLKKAVSPFPPHGIRHTALPTSGAMARTRAMAVADARKQAEEAAQAKLAELEEIAACSICSDLTHLLTPRTAAAIRHQQELTAATMRHEQERAWLESWKDTAAVEECSIWLGLPSGCAASPTAQSQLTDQQLQRAQRGMQWQEAQQREKQYGMASTSSAADVNIWMGWPAGSMATTPGAEQQRQQGLPTPVLGTTSAITGPGCVAGRTMQPAWTSQVAAQVHVGMSTPRQQQVGLPSLHPTTSMVSQYEPYRWDQQQRRLQQAAATAWFVRAHPIPVEPGSEDDSSSVCSVKAPLL